MDFADFAGGSLHLQRLYVFAFLPWQCQIASAGLQRVRMNIHPMEKSVKGNFKKIWEKVAFFHNSIVSNLVRNFIPEKSHKSIMQR